MRAVIQRVTESSVKVEGEIVGEIGPGLMVLLGIEEDDSEKEVTTLVKKITDLRIFNDENGKFNLSLTDTGGSVLVISQFTLLGDCRKGRRPSFIKSARPETAVPLYESVIEGLRKAGVEVASGVFGAHMDVHLINDGPVTLLIDTNKAF
ncbi:MAG: D-aminoacyl-tRNA deacylase [Candidatus Hydrogenedentota bacterium]